MAITSEDILSLNYYKYGNPFTGSFQGMRYRLVRQKEQKNEEGGVVLPEGLFVSVWPEPFSYENTDDTLKTNRLFSFDEEGKTQALEWLNVMYTSGTWKSGFTFSGLQALRRQQDV